MTWLSRDLNLSNYLKGLANSRNFTHNQKFLLTPASRYRFYGQLGVITVSMDTWQSI